MSKKEQLGTVEIFKPKQGNIDVRVQVEGDSLWLTQAQIADVFDKERSVVTKHIGAILRDGEVDKKSNVQKMHIANSDKPVALYSLDIVLAVGYRTNSARAIDFRKWATSVLKKYLIEGYAVNQKRLKQAQEQFAQLQSTVQFLQAKIGTPILKGKEQDVFALLSEYSKTLSVLEQYDTDTLITPKGRKRTSKLTYDEAIDVLTSVRTKLIKKKEATDLFARERGGEFEGIITGLYQGFGGTDLYPTLELKAAHLLYFVIKDHPFSDGNKRSASFLFVYFLEKNSYLYKKSGERKINDNALAALTLLVAESDPKEKETMVNLIATLITS